MRVNKHRRLSKIVQVLERWAPLETSEVTAHLSLIFDIPENDLKRNVLNDLKFLRDEGELIALYYNKFGKLESIDLEPEDGSYYKIKWQFAQTQEQLISGASELAQFQTHIQATPGFEDLIKVRKGIGQNSLEFFYFYFEVNHELYHLTIPKAPGAPKDTPYFHLAISRTSSQYPQSMAQDFKKIQTQDIPLIFLSFNNPFISSFDAISPLKLTFRLNGSVSFESSQNKNTIQFREIQAEKLKGLLESLTFFKDQTQTQHWTQISKKEENDYLTGDKDNLKAPVIFKIKDTAGFILQ